VIVAMPAMIVSAVGAVVAVDAVVAAVVAVGAWVAVGFSAVGTSVVVGPLVATGALVAVGAAVALATTVVVIGAVVAATSTGAPPQAASSATQKTLVSNSANRTICFMFPSIEVSFRFILQAPRRGCGYRRTWEMRPFGDRRAILGCRQAAVEYMNDQHN
jgi:hypothetical protein